MYRNIQTKFCFIMSEKVKETNTKSPTIPLRRQDLLKWYGWGYVDADLTVDPITGHIDISTDRYPLKENSYVPHETREWLIKVLNIDIFRLNEVRKKINMPKEFPEPIFNPAFIEEIAELCIPHSIEGEDRYIRAHGHGIDELITLRQEKLFPRIPDAVVWPSCHNEVVKIVKLATDYNVVLVPFGGGTNVSRALALDPNEQRMIISLDTSQMCRVLWVDKVNSLACCEAGIIGQDLGRELEKHGVTTGHEPDSYEFSSLGGWVATRASGMKKNTYGNIEDLVVHVRFVTAAGVLEKQNRAPRVSCGPDMNHLVLGSEGTLGVVTEVILKVRPLPEVKQYSSFVFPTFDAGIKFMHCVAKKQCQPASLRLIDNTQFKFGQLFKPEPGLLSNIIESMKIFYVTKWKGLDMDKISVCIAVFEGDRVKVDSQMRDILQISSEYEGLPAGSTNGERGYLITFLISYIRDLAFDFNVISESFETSVPWDRCASLCHSVKSLIRSKCKEHGIKYYMVSARVTQVYDTGACVYFYFLLNTSDVADSLEKFELIEAAARDEIISCGGSLSHHHGIGKIRKKWFKNEVSQLAVDICKSIKQTVDPANVFACGNLWQND